MRRANKQQHHKSDRAGELVVDWTKERGRSSRSALSRSDWVCSNVRLKIAMNSVSSQTSPVKENESQLIVGWTIVVSGLFLLIFSPLAGMVISLSGACVVSPVYLTRSQRKAADSEKNQRITLYEARASIGSDKEKALEYRDLFIEGVISREEYHNAVALLYPELRREMK